MTTNKIKELETLAVQDEELTTMVSAVLFRLSCFQITQCGPYATSSATVYTELSLVVLHCTCCISEELFTNGNTVVAMLQS